MYEIMCAHPKDLNELHNLLCMGVEHWFQKAHSIYGPKVDLALSRVEIRLDLRGQGAGTACSRVGGMYLRFNPKIAMANYVEFMKATVPHEVAHLVDMKMRGRSDHGPKWKAIMRAFGVTATRCHNYTKGVAKARQIKQFQYACKCSTFQLTSIRHNRSQRGTKYYCSKCRGPLFFTPDPSKDPSILWVAV